MFIASLQGPAGVHARELSQDHNALTLSEEVEIEIRAADDATVRYANRTKVLTRRGAEQFDQAVVYYEKGDRIVSFKGEVLLPTGKRLKMNKKAIVDGPAQASFELYSDSRYRAMTFTGVVPGAVVEYSFEKEVNSLHHIYEDRLDLQGDIPARHRSLKLVTPENFPLKISISGEPVYSREEEGGKLVQRWSIEDAPALKVERDGPPVRDLIPAVSVEPGLVSMGGRTVLLSTWDQVAAFYQGLAANRMSPGGEVGATASRVAAGGATPDEKARRIYEFVQEKVEYVAIELGIGGWQPHASGEVLRHRYGDCKDKATLMIAMLAAVGIEAYPSLIRTRYAGLLNQDQPALSFNHAIVALPAPEGFRFADPTSTDTAFGDLPWWDQGVPTLVVKPSGGGEVVTTPLSPPERNQRRFEIEGDIGATGSLRGTLLLQATGERRSELLPLADAAPARREAAVGRLVAEVFPGAKVTAHTVGTRDSGEPAVVVKAEFTLPRFLVRVGESELMVVPSVRLDSLASIAATESRTQPIFFEYLTRDTVVSRIRLPAGRTLEVPPGERELTGPGLLGRSSSEIVESDEGRVLVTTRLLDINAREIMPDQFAGARTFLSEFGAEQSRALTLSKE